MNNVSIANDHNLCLRFAILFYLVNDYSLRSDFDCVVQDRSFWVALLVYNEKKIFIKVSFF